MEKFERTFHEFANEKYHNEGYKSTWYYDVTKSQSGPYKTEVTYPKGHKFDKVKVEKKKPYSGQPVVMVFKTSNRSNARTKMKVWNNENVDYIMTAPELPGVPEDAIILELAVGEGFIELFNQKYSL
jgi:hypothetical protein